MKSGAIFLIAIGSALSACTTQANEKTIPQRGVTPGYQCEAEAVQNLIGQIATAPVGSAALQRSGAKTLRWIPPNTAVTMDFRQDRLNIEYDNKMMITRVNCG